MIDITKLNRCFDLFGYDKIESTENCSIENVIEKVVKQKRDKIQEEYSKIDPFYSQWKTIQKTWKVIGAYEPTIDEIVKSILDMYNITEDDKKIALKSVHGENNIYDKRVAIMKAIVVCKILNDVDKLSELNTIRKQNDQDIERENQRIMEEREQERKKNSKIIGVELEENNEITFIGKIITLSDQYESEFGINDYSNVLERFLDEITEKYNSKKYKITIKIEPV